MAIGVYLNPGEARVWIRQATHWGTEVLCDTLHTASALADEARATASQAGYASTTPGAQASTAYPPVSQDPTWAYVADGRGPGTTLGSPTSPQVATNGYAFPSAASPSQPGIARPQGSTTSSNVFPRVLASGASSGVPAYQSQPSATYPVGGENPTISTGSSPYAPTAQPPLRPSMEKEAPWARVVQPTEYTVASVRLSGKPAQAACECRLSQGPVGGRLARLPRCAGNGEAGRPIVNRLPASSRCRIHDRHSQPIPAKPAHSPTAFIAEHAPCAAQPRRVSEHVGSTSTHKRVEPVLRSARKPRRCSSIKLARLRQCSIARRPLPMA